MSKKWIITGLTATMLAGTPLYAKELQETPAPVLEAGNNAGQPNLMANQDAEDNPLGVFVPSGRIQFAIAPIIEEGNTLAPYEQLLERLGFEAKWDEKTGVISAEKRNLSLRLKVGSLEATVNGEKKELPAAPKLLGGIPFIPLRFVAEADMRQVSWDGQFREISISEGQALTELRIVYRMDAQTDVKPLEALAKQVEAETGIRLELIGIPSEYYQQKMTVLIAAGDLPDLMFVPDQTIFPLSLGSAVFKELTDYLPEYPHLDKLAAQAPELRLEGKLYGLAKPKSRYDERFPALRADWLKPLDLQMPQTMDELYRVMADFKSKDPDGNGKDDTVGFAGKVKPDSLGDFAWVEHVFNESAGRYKLVGGKIVDTVAEPGELQALHWLSRAFRDGVLKGDFAADPSGKSYGFSEGNAGMASLTVDEAVAAAGKLRQTFHKADAVPLISLQAPGKTKVVPVGPGQSGMFAVSNRASEAKTKLILSFLDRLAGSAGSVADGMTPQTAGQLDSAIGWNAAGGAMSDEAAALKQALLQERERVSFEAVNPVDGRLLESKDKAKLQELDVKTTEMKLKLIMGKISDEQWHAYVEQLKTDAAYQDIMKKLNTAYAKLNGK
ncbi:extracellular solute-binding protein [Paenibacillus sp. MBLB4367]|uniref:extracellular solute-binding protein n=1 Tax=Paenibacillus sp. MBLB4367 TaxID=3384767 RepID=UPI0039084376